MPTKIDWRNNRRRKRLASQARREPVAPSETFSLRTVVSAASHSDVSVDARTRLKLFTGGKAGVNHMNLIQLHCSGEEYGKPDSGPWMNTQTTTIDLSTMRVLGQSVGSDGNLWVALPDNGVFDLNLCAPPRHYDAGATVQKYVPYITANGTDLSTTTPEFCVGQQVTFTLNNLPMGSISNMVGNWQLPTKYVNDHYDADDEDYVNCQIYYINSYLLANTNSTSCWFVNGTGGTVGVGLNLLFNNGQDVNVASVGKITVYRPSFTNFTQQTYDLTWNFPSPLSWLEADMSWKVTLNSKYDGQYGITQLLLGTGFYYGTGGEYVLDGDSEIYGDAHDGDGPSIYKANDPASQTLFFLDSPTAPTTSMDLTYKDYLRFQPSGSGSIYVTIATNGWSVDASYNVLTSVFTPANIPPATYPVDNDEFPIWYNFRSGH